MERTEQQAKIMAEIEDAVVAAEAALVAIYGERRIRDYFISQRLEWVTRLAAGFLAGRRNIFPIAGDRLI